MTNWSRFGSRLFRQGAGWTQAADAQVPSDASSSHALPEGWATACLWTRRRKDCNLETGKTYSARKPVNDVLLSVPVAEDALEVHLLSFKGRHRFSVMRVLKSNPVIEAIELSGIQLKPVQGRSKRWWRGYSNRLRVDLRMPQLQYGVSG